MNIFKQFYRSLYSPKDIANVRKQKMGKTILYLLLLSIIASLPSLIFISKGMNEAIHTLKETMKNEVPSYSISNGKLQLNTEEPIIIDKPNLKVILDPTGTYQVDNVSTIGNTFALLDKEFVLVTAGQSQSYTYASLGNMTISDEMIIVFLETMDSNIYVLITILVIVFLFFMTINHVFQTLILAVFGQLFAKLFGRSLRYGQVWKMTVYSITIPVVFFAIMEGLQTFVTNGYLINWFVSLLLVFLSIKEVPINKATPLDQ